MHSARLKPTFLVLALGFLSLAGPAQATTYTFRVPSQGAKPAPSIGVTLAGATLPSGKINTAYLYDFNTLLTVAGDNAPVDPASVTWQLASGTLPGGLSLSSNGVLGGTPTAYTAGSSFQVQASYKNKAGSQTYTIVINDVVLHVSQVVAGDNFTCAVTTSGGAKCWGANNAGQLGNNSTANSSVPVDVVGLTSGVASLAAGSNSACAVTTSGSAKCWGWNAYGQLGNNGTAQSTVPVDVVGLTSGVASITAGSWNNFACAVTTTGGAKCWGDNGHGQLGNSGTAQSAVPVDVEGLTSGVASLSAGSGFTCAVTTSGGAKCWGSGPIGNSSVSSSPVPVDVSGLTSGVARISAGVSSACALTSAGGVQCWGFNWFGQLGNSSTSSSTVPVNVTGLLTGATSIAVGNNSACALTTLGGVKCWGANSAGQLGNGTTTSATSPVSVTGLTSGAASVSVGNGHACAVTATSAKCWGSNGSGQLGSNSTTSSSVPVDVVTP